VLRFKNMRFNLRTLFAVMALFGIAVAAGAGVFRYYSAHRFVTSQVEVLNGAVSVDFPNGSVHFSVGGLPPLVRDSDLEKLSPHLAWLNVPDVYLAETKISDKGFRALATSCQNSLVTLDLTGTAVTEESVKLLPSLKKLRSISLSQNLLTETGINALATIPSLRIVRVYGAKADDQRVRSLEKIMVGRGMVEAHEQQSILSN
jgi:hypothetical protein